MVEISPTDTHCQKNTAEQAAEKFTDGDMAADHKGSTDCPCLIPLPLRNEVAALRITCNWVTDAS